MLTLSICIPTYNRRIYLINCLNSIKLASKKLKFDFNVCISDNSDYSNRDIIKRFKKYFKIIYFKNKYNIGFAKNLLQAVNLSSARFIWLIGDDDLVHLNGLKIIKKLLNKKKNLNIDFYYLNSGNIKNEKILKKTSFNTNKIKKIKKCSNFNFEGKLSFMRLIDKKISFDFLGGIFNSLFKRELWEKKKNVLNIKKINDLKTFTSLDNTFPHAKIFAYAFNGSMAYFSKKIVSINLSRAREWKDYWPIIFSIRIPEILDEYRKNGLNFYRYYLLKNYSLRAYFPHIIYILLNKKKFNISYKYIFMNFIKNVFFINTYLSLIYYLIRIVKKQIN